MEETKKMKMCPFCDGRIEIDAVSCTFCGRNITSYYHQHQAEMTEPSSSNFSNSYSKNDSLSSLYPPPYRPKIQEEHLHEEEEEEFTEEVEEHESDEVAKAESQTLFSTILLLSVGVQVFLFGLLLLLFSTEGRVILEWNAKRWFLYMLLSAPMIYFGYKKITRLKN